MICTWHSITLLFPVAQIGILAGLAVPITLSQRKWQSILSGFFLLVFPLSVSIVTYRRHQCMNQLTSGDATRQRKRKLPEHAQPTTCFQRQVTGFILMYCRPHWQYHQIITYFMCFQKSDLPVKCPFNTCCIAYMAQEHCLTTNALVFLYWQHSPNECILRPEIRHSHMRAQRTSV